MNDFTILSLLFVFAFPVGVFLSILALGSVYEGTAVFLVAAVVLLVYMDNHTGIEMR
jgi:sterol desaturase/sphingolipid hydroxylase (fatty acid hydroxylase superfamily)